MIRQQSSFGPTLLPYIIPPFARLAERARRTRPATRGMPGGGEQQQKLRVRGPQGEA